MAKSAACTENPLLTAARRIGLFRTMYAARRIDDREIAGKRQNKVFFQINGAGHEAIQAAAALCLRPGHDWFFLYYRDRALAYGLGVTAKAMFLASVGSAQDPASGGRQMPSHWSDPRLNIFTTSSPTGSQCLQAVGAAEAVLRAREPGLRDALGIGPDQVVLVTVGDGTAAEGEFWESLNSAVTLGAPVVFLVQDNGYAISVPTEVQYPGGNLAALLGGWEAHGLLVLDGVDGSDPEASHAAMARAVAHARAGRGPALVRARVTRPYSHSLSDDEQAYKTAVQRAEEAARDPLVTYPARLLAAGDLAEAELEALKAEVQEEVDRAWAEAESAPPPPAGECLHNLYSETVDPCGPAFDTEASAPPEGGGRTMIDLINATLRQEMARDPRILVFGQDVADASREEILEEVKGKGGVFKATFGLQREFGSRRVFNAPLAEATILGRAIGLAARGFKPVVEIQFLDYIWPAMQQLRDELACIRWRSNGGFKAPVVVRVPVGGYLMGGAICHSQSGESLFTHLPGLRVVCPSRAVDAAGLLRTAIRCDDPVLFLEPKHLYRQTHNKGGDPGPEFMVPFGKARTVLEGEHLSVLTFGNTVHRALQAARLAAAEGIRVEILDLRSLNPYDWPAVAATVRRTRRVLVAHEDTRSWGYGAELAARIADELFFELDAPVRRLAAQDTWVAYHPDLEARILPQPADFLEAYRALVRI